MANEKGTLGCCELQIIFKSERKLSNMFRFKDRLLYDLVSGVTYEHFCGRNNSSNYGETKRHLKVRSGEHIGKGGSRTAATSKMERFVIELLSQSAPSWMLQQS